MLTLKCSANIKKLEKLSQNPEVDLWAMDEVRFQQYGSRCRMWIPPEDKEPVLLHHPIHRSIGYFGALRVRDGKFIFKPEAHRFNAQTFWDFLKEVQLLSSADGQRVVLILDNARYHCVFQSFRLANTIPSGHLEGKCCWITYHKKVAD